jgi:Fe-S-cluster containining protein
MSKNLCEGCGVCCRAFSLPPFDANDPSDVPEELHVEIDAHARSPHYRDSDPCFWQDPDTLKCRHHNVRPVLCRWFEPGGEPCNELRLEAGLPRLERHPVRRND